MKKYEKPKLMVLSISANDALCNSCGRSLRYDEDLQFTLGNMVGNKDGILDSNEMTSVFSTEDGCSMPVDYDGYCKFTATNNIFIS